MPNFFSIFEMLACDKLQIEQMIAHGIPRLKSLGGLTYTPQLQVNI
jgi:hypothetical protein